MPRVVLRFLLALLASVVLGCVLAIFEIMATDNLGGWAVVSLLIWTFVITAYFLGLHDGKSTGQFCNPIVYDHEFRLGCVKEYGGQPNYIIHVFKRQGMPVSFHEANPLPSGGEGYVSREADLERIRQFGTKEDIEEAEKIPQE